MVRRRRGADAVHVLSLLRRSLLTAAVASLALTKAGLAARDALVLDAAAAAGAPVCVCLAGGYAPDIRDTVEINLATARLVARRSAAVSA